MLTYLKERIREVLTGSSDAIVVRVFGRDLDTLHAKASELRAEMEGIEGIIDLPEAVAKVTEADGILLSPGMMTHCGSVFGSRGAPLAIIRLNCSTVFCEQWTYHEARTAQVSTPAEAMAMKTV